MSSRTSKTESEKEPIIESYIEELIQAQVVHLSSAAEEQEIQRPGTFPCGRRTGSKLVFPIVHLGKDGIENPVLLGIVMTGLHGKSLIFGYQLEDLDGDLKEELEQLIEFEGLSERVNWPADALADVLLDHRKALILLPNDVLYARENGWNQLFEDVKTGVRTTNRTAVRRMGRLILGSDRQVDAYNQIANESA
jgi:hypothetical protein